ncbi:MAG TPA: hypothetical protein VM925_14530, partial [Labilithrix sp.]|nr:hypothetical protein [Labilithrix sp.]
MVQRRSVALIIVGVLLTIEGMAEATDAPDGMWRAEVVTPPGCVDTFREQLRARAPHVVFTDDAARVFRVRIAEAGDHLRGTLEVDKMGASTHREIEGSECDEVLRWFDFAKEMVFMRVRFILGALAVAASLVGCGGIVDLGSVEPGRPDARAAERREGADGADAIVTGDTSAKAEETPEGTSVGEVFGEPFVVQGGASMMFATTSPPYEAGRFFLLTPYPK